METCITQKQFIPVHFACTKRLLTFSEEVTMNVLNALLRVKCALFFLKNKRIRFFLNVTNRFFFWKDTKINLRFSWRCQLSIHGKRRMKFITDVLNFSFKDEKPSKVLFDSVGQFFVRKASRN